MSTSDTPQIPQQDLWAALQRQSNNRNRPDQRVYSTFERGEADVVDISGSEPTANLYDLHCPRSECGSCILKKGTAAFVERESLKLQPDGLAPHPLLPSMPDPPATTAWWLVEGSPMNFENIGFSKPVEGLALGPSGKKLKLLACAECDLGPLGWSEEGGTEYWLAVNRVGYVSSGK